MKLRLNGEEREVGDVFLVSDVVSFLGLAPQTTLVELNGQALLRSEWNLAVKEGDQLEFLQVAAGG